MSITRADLQRRSQALAHQGVPYVTATVIRAQRPSSVRPGDAAIVHADGRIEGFVGGTCAETSVQVHSRRVLETGEALLLRILPGEPAETTDEGAVTVQNPCLSGGGLEIFLEPRLPAPRVLVVGDTPIARAVLALGAPLGYDMESCDAQDVRPEDRDIGVVVASHGRGEEAALAAALASDVGYVGLVASKTRGAAVADALGLPPSQRDRLHTPAGLALGARTPEEIALSILAEIVATRRAAATAVDEVEHEVPPVVIGDTAIDPICGMTVAVTADALRLEHAGQTVYFCGEGCRRAFAADLPREHRDGPIH